MIVNRWVAVLLIAAVVVVLTGCAANANTSSGKAQYTTTSTQQLQAAIDAGEKLVIVDLREPELYRAGHIPGAKNIPFEQFDKRMGELNADDNIVLVCHNGPMGDVSGSLLAERGYAHVQNVSGGMAAWRGKLAK